MTEQEKKELQERVKSVIERVNNAAVQAGRDPSEITLVAATKMNDAERVQAAIEAGIRVCGENRVQELQEKYEQNAYDGADLQFIGTLQTNKVKYLIGKVSLIQSVGSVHLGEGFKIIRHSHRQIIHIYIIVFFRQNVNKYLTHFGKVV